MKDLATVNQEVIWAMITIAFIMLCIAVFYYKNPPVKINKLYGYRTRHSMKNQEIWTAANKHSSIMFINHALILFVITVVLSFLKIPYSLLIFLVVLLGGILFGALRTSQFLKNNFDQEGNKK